LRKSKGGFFTAADLGHQTARWGEPLQGTYRGVTIYETPAPTQGFTVLEMLNLLEPLELHRKDRLGPDLAHLMVQAKQIAYHDRDRHLADPLFTSVPIQRLISKPYADWRRALIDPRAPCRGTACPRTAACVATPCSSPRWTPKATPPR
jgi:gamma-glutamyltranspeptidase/glutathione hydrolase